MRSLRTKLVLIMILLILALMTVAGSFLINGVGNFYIGQFYNQMTQTFSPDFIRQLQGTAAAVAELYSKGFDQPYNAILAVYDYQFEGSRYVPGAPARFVGSFPYIER